MRSFVVCLCVCVLACVNLTHLVKALHGWLPSIVHRDMKSQVN